MSRRTKKPQIWLVTANEHYEGGYPFVAFFAEKPARELLDKCNAYHATRPEFTAGISDEEDAEWQRQIRRQNRWQARHPAGKENATCAYFNCYSVDLMSAPTSTGDKP